MNEQKLITMCLIQIDKDGIILEDLFNHLYIYRITNIETVESIYGIERYLDNFYILLPETPYLRSIFWKEFYSCYGIQYEKLIDACNNLKCIETLLLILEKRKIIDSQSHLLDFGCGSGISTLTRWKYQIIGYEYVEVMKQQAEKRGMTVITPETIQSKKRDYFDAVFGSYVFHMVNTRADLKLVLPLLKENAVWIMNFYKNKNIMQVHELFSDLGYTGYICKKGSDFGDIYLFEKT